MCCSWIELGLDTTIADWNEKTRSQDCWLKIIRSIRGGGNRVSVLPPHFLAGSCAPQFFSGTCLEFQFHLVTSFPRLPIHLLHLYILSMLYVYPSFSFHVPIIIFIIIVSISTVTIFNTILLVLFCPIVCNTLLRLKSAKNCYLTTLHRI